MLLLVLQVLCSWVPHLNVINELKGTVALAGSSHVHRLKFARLYAHQMKNCSSSQMEALALGKKTGVLLVNTGTPEQYTYFSIRKFLAEFLSDRRVIELPRIIWLPILYLFVLTRRPFKKRNCYKSIWNAEKNESPLRTISRNQALHLATRLESRLFDVEWAFRYGNPSISSSIQALKDRGCNRLLLFPLFPQFAGPTTATIVDEVFRCLSKQRHQMSLRVVSPFFDNDVYITAVVKKIQEKLDNLDFSIDAIIFSYHGLPVDYCLKGDPYEVQCEETTRLLKQKLSYDGQFFTTYQSRYGKGKWLQPYTEDMVVELAKSNIKNLLIVTPGFLGDCIETVREIAAELESKFRENGGQRFVLVSCLNDSPEGIDMLETIVYDNV
ncbi:unnamed protein product [Enterobius vermicularis]|uniref:Ferrochelatase n=1 Tax=Enterobius vermicularis TaxID=51028 RepID=A0A0N4V888_ENTVE|nr:unnamed protein product [Enterobius vermicularis]